MRISKINLKNLLVLFAFVAVGATSLIVLHKTFAAPDPFQGAIFTTDPNYDTNVNIYNSASDVYLTGGSNSDNGPGLPANETFYFEVTNPSGSVLLSTDNAECRQVRTNSNGRIFGNSTAVPGTCTPHSVLPPNPNNGSIAVQLLPFTETPNNGGSYQVTLIRKSAAGVYIDTVNPKKIHYPENAAKSDNFKIKLQKVECTEEEPCDFSIGGMKFYDANGDGLNNDGPNNGIFGFLIWSEFTPQLSTEPNAVIRQTLADGTWSVSGVPANTDYFVQELLPSTINDRCPVNNFYWRQTAPAAGTYNGTVTTDITGLDFGNICFRPGANGRTLGFWSNKNGQALINGADLQDLVNLPLVNANGTPFNPSTNVNTGKGQVKTWLLSGNAVNMAYMLSVQLAANKLSTNHSLNPNTLVDATDFGMGIKSIAYFQQQAVLLLTADNYTVSGNPNRADQELIKDILDAINNNRLGFANASPEGCMCYRLPLPPAG